MGVSVIPVRSGLLSASFVSSPAIMLFRSFCLYPRIQLFIRADYRKSSRILFEMLFIVQHPAGSPCDDLDTKPLIQAQWSAMMRPPLDFPYVLMNMAMSVDGKISTRRRESITLGTSHDRLLMDKLRAQVDAVIIGAGTLKADGFPLLVRDADIRRRRTNRGLHPHPVNVLLSRRLDIPARKKFFFHPESQRIIYTSRSAAQAQRKKFEKKAEIVQVPARTSFLKYVLTDLAGRGFNKVLVEGGGELNYSFFQEGLVNEIYLTVTPRVIGGGEAPTVVDGKGFLKHDLIGLKLRSAKRVGDELFLRYLVE